MNMLQPDEYVNAISLILHRARLSPDSVALQFQNAQITYDELDRRSNAIAAALIEAGITSGDCVGLHAGRSIELIVGLIGIFRAGAVYLPLDPNYPKNRNSFSVEEAKCRLILTGPPIDDAAYPGIKSLSIVDAQSRFLDAPRLTECSAGPNDPSYLIYTSGSTGRPNGVLGLNRPLAIYIRWLKEHIGVVPRDRILNVSSISFDPSLRDIFVPLSAGATLVLMSQQEAKDPFAFVECIAKQQVTKLLSITPTLLRRLCALEKSAGESLNAILTCGEPLTYELVNLVRRKFGLTVRMFNMYGPTECTMTTTAFEVEDDIAERKGAVPIGFPRAGTEIDLLAEDGSSVPKGAVGEIFISGCGLTAGYLHRPELMRRRFIRRQLASNSSQLLFKTGDFARRLDDGALMFEGRIDDQIKIRGERIDIGEIEAAIAKLVDEVGVIAMREGTYAFVVVALGGEGVKEDVLAACRDNISSVAIPRKVFLMDELPHTPSGKIDRKALRDHVHSWKSRQTYQSPTTELEKKVALIWMEVLETNEFGIDTEFLATGGDSMHAANIANRLSDLVALEIPSYLVIEAMTIRNIAAVIESVLEESDWSRQTERRVH